MDPRLFTPYLIVAIVVWALYRRMRRSFGRQRVRDGRMWLRIGVLTVVALLIAAGVARDVTVLGALLAGIACGAGLAYIGIKYTRFEVTAEGRFYTPHAYIGLVVAALFVGRLLYRFLAVYNGALPPASTGQNLATAYQHSPFTLAVFGALVGYYVPYYLTILRRVGPAASAQQAVVAAPHGK